MSRFRKRKDAPTINIADAPQGAVPGQQAQQSWPQNRDPRERCNNCGNPSIFASYNYKRLCFDCEDRRIRDWKCLDAFKVPTDAERAYAQATMPGKADGHIYGYRKFSILEGDPRGFPLSLASLSRAERTVWPPGEPAVAIDKGAHYGPRTPGPGLYAYSHLNFFYENTNLSYLSGCLAEVALWGTVIEYEGGYRARFGYPTLIVIPRPRYIYAAKAAKAAEAAEVMAERLGEVYGCPAITAVHTDVLATMLNTLAKEKRSERT